ncbi:uncharacterized protein METZ01_LOCUS449619, partial [marine metagenome]
VKDEQANFAAIAAGVEPPMLEEGQNHGLRLQVLGEIAQKNPRAVERLSDDAKSIWQARIQHLNHMVQQEQNKQIGRKGAAPALPQG